MSKNNDIISAKEARKITDTTEAALNYVYATIKNSAEAGYSKVEIKDFIEYDEGVRTKILSSLAKQKFIYGVEEAQRDNYGALIIRW